MLPKWVKSLTTWSGIYGIAINPATKWIIAHSGYRTPNLILILDSDGNLKGAYSYTGIPDYDRFWRNLLLGYDSATSTYTALLQTSLSSGSGYKLFAFTFSSSSSTPTFKWGVSIA
jgi:hypothetical protein